MSPEELKKLQEKYFSGLCTQEELEQLMHDENFTLIKQQWFAERGDQEQLKRNILSQLHQSMEILEAKEPIDIIKVPLKRSFKLNYYYATAAAVAIVLFTLIFLPRNTNNNQKIAKAAINKKKEIIKPGSNKATLTLSNGIVIDLSHASNGVVSRQGNISVSKTADGKLIYKITAKKTGDLVYNTLSTPRGGEYQVILPDGTKVWLNAASSLRFPSNFTGKERKIELSGEAYFEVAKDKAKPFKIAVDKMGIEVLGTHFNVNAYPGEAKIKTTLLEGSVKLTTGKIQSLLNPGQEASLNQHDQSGFDIRKVNTQDAIAWKNGYFVFDNQNIQDIMRKIARWYDMDVEYKGKVEQGNFGGTVSRFDNVDAILKSLEFTGTVHFKVEGRRITVMP